MITDIQFEALAALAKLHADSKSRRAAREVFVCGYEIESAAKNHGLTADVVEVCMGSITRAIKLTHQAVTGIKAQP